VSVGVFDVAGRLVRTLHEGAAQMSEYHTTWDGTNEHGDAVASGVYFVRVSVGSESLERKVVLLR
jgi:flagellar hook assembly protein FlgD